MGRHHLGDRWVLGLGLVASSRLNAPSGCSLPSLSLSLTRRASSCCGSSEEKMPSQGILQGSGITSIVTAGQLSSGHLANLTHGLFWQTYRQNIPVLEGPWGSQSKEVEMEQLTPSVV